MKRLVWALIAVLLPGLAVAQVFVYPRRPNKSQVRYYDFNWQHVDILVGPDADTSQADEIDGRERRPEVPGTDRHVPTGDTPPPGTPTPTGEPTPGGGGGFPAFNAHLGQVPDAGGAALDAGAADGGVADGGVPGQLPPDAGLAAQLVPPGPVAFTGADGGVPGPDGGYAHALPSSEAPFAERSLAALRDPKQLLTARTGGVRLYFYEREREIAERAAALIVDSYVYLVGQFDYVPTQTFPYVLYSSYQEFLQTNLFPLQEGTLGVTSPSDLKLTLPYFGDDQLFAEVSAHEMAHQFTIQKVRTVTEEAEIWGDPLGAIPLWFIEGLAEYYAKQGIDPEAEMLVRDLVINPDFELGYVLLDFFEDRPWSVMWTYKMGQVRVAFLEETYGAGITQRILAESPRLVGEVKGQPAIADFRALLGRLTGDEPNKISVKFEAWLKRRAYRTYLASRQSTPAVEPIEDFGMLFVDALAASPSGNLVAIRSMDEITGRSRLTVFDWRAPDKDELVVIDGVPGAESLHPIWGRNFDLRDDRMVYVAETEGTDVLYWREIRHSAEKMTVEEVRREQQLPPNHPVPVQQSPLVEEEDLWNVELDVHGGGSFDLRKKGLIAAYAPVFSPDGKRIAFIGFDFDGSRDVYVLDPDPNDPDGFRLIRLTNDPYAERQLSWGNEGIVYNSEATQHGRYNLFRVQPAEGGAIERLTTEPRDHLNPQVLPAGNVLFTAYDRGRADIHEVRDGAVIRRTDITTGLFDLAPGPDGGVWALYHAGGRRHPVRVPKERLLSLERLPQPPALTPQGLARRPLVGAEPYNAYAPRNWELGPPFGYVGAGAGGIVGQIVASASDKLRNQALLLNVAVLGDFELTDGYLVYMNQERRITWGTGLFQSLVYRQDQTFEGFSFPSGERFYGVLGSARYPFNQFVYVQGDLSVGGVSYFLFPTFERILTDPAMNPQRRNLLPQWLNAHEGPRLQTEGTLRFGYDTIRYGGLTGPVAGSSFLAEGTTAYQPMHQEVFGTLRLDAERYWPIIGTANLFVRGGAGTTFGGRLARQFYLSSFDTLRGIPFGSTDWLIGRHFLFTTAELQVPLNSVIRILILNNIEAVAGVDFGGVGQELREVWDRRVLAPVLGVNFGLGPLVLRLHFARPIGIGAPAGLPAPAGEWVTNFSIRILGFEGFFDRRNDGTDARQKIRGPTLIQGAPGPLF